MTAYSGLTEASPSGRIIASTDHGGRLTHLRPRMIAAAAEAVDKGRYDVVHVHAGLVTPLAFSVAARSSTAGTPTLLTVHSLVSYLYPAFRLANIATRWTRWPIAWTAVSDLAARPLGRLLGADTPVPVLPNAVDRDWWRVDPMTRDGSDVLLVAVMRLAPRKRPMHLVRMLRQVRRAVPSSVRITALIIGEGPERHSLERYLARHHMTCWVYLPGRLSHEQIRDVYRRADMFVAPANLESFGIAAMEARVAGLPVVAMARAGIREFIRDGREGALVDGDRGMVAALTALASDPATRFRIASHNLAVAPSWGWPDVLALTDREYERAAAIQRLGLSPQARPRPVTRIAV